MKSRFEAGRRGTRREATGAGSRRISGWCAVRSRLAKSCRTSLERLRFPPPPLIFSLRLPGSATAMVALPWSRPGAPVIEALEMRMAETAAELSCTGDEKAVTRIHGNVYLEGRERLRLHRASRIRLALRGEPPRAARPSAALGPAPAHGRRAPGDGQDERGRCRPPLGARLDAGACGVVRGGPAPRRGGAQAGVPPVARARHLGAEDPEPLPPPRSEVGDRFTLPSRPLCPGAPRRWDFEGVAFPLF